MRTLKTIIIVLLSSVASIVIGQEKSKKPLELNFNVNGVCDMCKERIEGALDVKGIKFSEWSEKSHNCKVVYKPSQISEKEIHQLIADAGHDTEAVKANDEVYKKMHHCCQYRK